jgi:TetR/AcrR family transcriptional regulator, transcriptional repressor for nem operon
MAEASPSPKRRITARGLATRDRIVTTADRLMRGRGVAPTTMEDVRVGAGVSNSQLYFHFPDKDALVDAVVRARSARILDLQERRLRDLDSIAGLEHWRDAHVEASAAQGAALGCGIGSMSAELADHDEAARAVLQEGFERWRTLLADGLRRMVAAGELSSDADPEALAIGLLAALQGGYVLAQSARDSSLIRTAVDMAIDRVRDFDMSESRQSDG